jgi:hypothetical protein
MDVFLLLTFYVLFRLSILLVFHVILFYSDSFHDGKKGCMLHFKGDLNW